MNRDTRTLVSWIKHDFDLMVATNGMNVGQLKTFVAGLQYKGDYDGLFLDADMENVEWELAVEYLKRICST